MLIVMKYRVYIAFVLLLVILVSLVAACGEESNASKTDSKEKENEPYMELVSAKKNFAESCYDYEYGEKKYLTFDFSKDRDINGYIWFDDKITVTTNDGKELESINKSDEDVSYKFVDSEEYTIDVRYDSIEGQEKYQTFTVSKDNIVVNGKPLDPSECKEEKPESFDFDAPDLDKPEGDIDSPVECGAGAHWVSGHYRDGTWVEGHCRSD